MPREWHDRHSVNTIEDPEKRRFYLSNFPGGAGSGSGGLTLAAVTNITTQVASGRVYVKWTDPEDIIVSGTALATWGGTLLVRKAGFTPVSRRDGTVVLDSKTRNAYSGTYFCDSSLANGTTYYYKLFPYTTEGAYTNSAEDEFNATPTAQVAGITDWMVTNMTASSEAGDGKMTVKWTDPAATITADGIELATWASTTVVVKSGSYPTGKDDAAAAYTLKSTTRNQYASTALTIAGLTNGTTYYIAFYPETSDGGINTSTTQRTTGTANRITIANVPSQSGTLTYNKSSQSPTWSNYNTTYMTIGGTTSATNAGSYTASFTPKTDYRWSDGTTAAKSVSWSIGKATGTLTVSVSSITLNADTPSASFTVGGNWDGDVGARLSNLSIITASVREQNGTTYIDVSSIDGASGSTVITVTCSEGTNYTAPNPKTVSVTCAFISEALDDNTWSVISGMSASGKAAALWSVGDTKTITVKGTVGTLSVNTSLAVYIIGFDHDKTEGIVFGAFIKALSTMDAPVCLVDSKYSTSSLTGSLYFNMNHSSNSNSGGWKNCDLRYDILGSTKTKGENAVSTTATSPVANTLMAALPSDLRAVMKPMVISADVSGNATTSSSAITDVVDYLPLLSEYEVFGATTKASSHEQDGQTQYDYYAAGNMKVKWKHTTGSTTSSQMAMWWLRSPDASNATSFCRVSTAGAAGSLSAQYSLGLAPIFNV